MKASRRKEIDAIRAVVEERRAAGEDVLLRVLSLGAGVQSTTLALMYAHGEIQPSVDVALFADTGWEPKPVYQHLRWLASGNVLPFPVITASAGNLRDGILARRNATGGRFASVPWWTVNPDGSHGMGRRQCTSEYKLTPLMRASRDLLSVGRRDRIPSWSVEVAIGISRDEASRMKPARQRWMRNHWPLCDRLMTRADCLAWLARHGYPEPPKSACIGCPFHSDAMWRDMRDNRPDEWADAVAVDRALREGDGRGVLAVEFMHPQRVPLEQVDLRTPEDAGQRDLFGNECEGMCGL